MEPSHPALKRKSSAGAIPTGSVYVQHAMSAEHVMAGNAGAGGAQKGYAAQGSGSTVGC